MRSKICVYCASSPKVDDKFFKAAEELGEVLVKNDVTTVFGGGGKGLMGRLADTVIKCGGEIIGIMPEFMDKVEWGHKNLTEMIFVDTMHRRKELLIEGVDAVVALPGGCGTMEELFEVITLKRLNLFSSPIIIVNTDGFYDDLLNFMNTMVDEKFMSERHRKIWEVIDTPDKLFDAIDVADNWESYSLELAAV